MKYAQIGLCLALLSGCGDSTSDVDSGPDVPSLRDGSIADDATATDDALVDAGSNFDGGRDAGARDSGSQDAGGGCDPLACRAESTCMPDAVCVAGACMPGVLVDTDAALEEAIAAGEEALILVAPGSYGVTDMVMGVDRSALPLTIQGADACDRPVFLNATQSIRLTRHVTFRDLSFLNDGALSGGTWIGDGGGNGSGGDAHHITIERCDFTAPSPGGLDDATPDADYADAMMNLFQFSNYATHTYAIRDIEAIYVRQVGDFRMNGDVVLDGLTIDFWYFDGIRIVGSGDEGYVEGDRLIANVDLTNNLAVYEEMGNRAPHPDNTQVFNTGSTANNTNPRVENLLFYRNRFNPGQYRSSNTQSGLTQTRMINVGYVENLWATLGSVHGVSLEGGADGVLIERMTMGDVNWEARPWVRIFRATGQVLVEHSFFPSGYNTATNQNANLAGYELEDIDNVTSGSYDAVFQGPARASGIDGLVAMFTPRDGVQVGALDASGSWRGGAHRPLRAAAPSVSGVTGAFRIDAIHEPTLQSPDQTDVGGDSYTRRDLRWSRAGDYDWTIVRDAARSDMVESVPAGTMDVQTRCVNSAGEGLWSRTATVRVD